MNVTSTVGANWLNDIQYGNKGAAMFIVAYIGFYGLSIICLFGQQLKETQRQRHELPAYFLKTLWDVPNKNKLYQELADVEYLKRIFRAYFADHETYVTVKHDDLQTIVDERAQACALRYQQKLRRLHLSHMDYYLDTVPRLVQTDMQKRALKSTILTRRRNIDYTNIEENENHILSISVV